MTYTTIEPRQNELLIFLDASFPTNTGSNDYSSLNTWKVPENELEIRLSAARKDKKLVKLMKGEMEIGPGKEYPSHSEADLGLFIKLAFYFGPDPAALEKMARKSALVRKKWDRPDYMKRTISDAIKKQNQIYQLSKHENVLKNEDNTTPEKAENSPGKSSEQNVQQNRFLQAMIQGDDLHDKFIQTISQGHRIKNILPLLAKLIVIYGPPGVFKSFIALDMLLHIAKGRTWHGREVSQCNVVYVAAEGGAGSLKRVQTSKNYYGDGDAGLFTLIPCPCLLDDGKDLNELITALKPLKPGVIVFDTLARSMAGDENSTSDMNKLVNACTRIIQELDCQVILIHHTGKDETRGARGSIALTGATDAMFRVKASGEKQATLICDRQKDDEPFPEMIFSMEIQSTGYVDEDNNPINSLVPVHDPDALPARKSGPIIRGQSKIGLDAFMKALEESGEYPSSEVMARMNGKQASSKVIHEDQWRKYAYKMGISEMGQDAMKKGFNRARTKLMDERLVECWGGYYWKV